MSNVIDISARITNELPIVKITDDIVATVNNRKSTILNMQLMIKEQEIKSKRAAQENGDQKEEYDEIAFMDKILSMLISPKSVEAINKMDLPLPEYKIVYQGIMAAATGQSQEEIEKRFQ
jgi:hypothetical protein